MELFLDNPAKSSNASNEGIEKEPANNFVTIIVIFVILLILLLNGFLISIIKFKPEVLQKTFSLHIMTLCFTDFLVGLSAIPLLSIYIYQQEMRYEFCAATLAFYAISQCAALYHVLGICIYRILVLRKLRTVSKTKGHFLFYHVVIMWMCIPILLSVPFIVWGQPGTMLAFCSTETVFSSHYNKAMGYIISFNIPAILLTNTLYIYLKIVLIKQQRSKVIPDSRRHKIVTVTEMSTPPRKTATDSSSSTWDKTRSAIQIQGSTLVTIGIVLLLFDIFTLPLSITFLFEISIASLRLSRKARAILVLITIFNSALNPIVYTARMKHLREIIFLPFHMLQNRVRNLLNSINVLPPIVQ